MCRINQYCPHFSTSAKDKSKKVNFQKWFGPGNYFDVLIDILFIHSGKLSATRNIINRLILGQFVQSDFFLILLSLLKIFQVRKCTVDSKDNKEDKTREEADMTLSPFFSKVSKAVKKWSKIWVTVKNTQNMDLDHSKTLLDTLGPLLKILEKPG